MPFPQRPPHPHHQVVGSAAGPHVVVGVADRVEGGQLVLAGDDNNRHRLGAAHGIDQRRRGPVLTHRRQVNDCQIVRYLKRLVGARWPQGREETVGLERVCVRR